MFFALLTQCRLGLKCALPHHYLPQIFSAFYSNCATKNKLFYDGLHFTFALFLVLAVHQLINKSHNITCYFRLFVKCLHQIVVKEAFCCLCPWNLALGGVDQTTDFITGTLTTFTLSHFLVLGWSNNPTLKKVEMFPTLIEMNLLKPTPD